jgi:hypothetical protein
MVQRFAVVGILLAAWLGFESGRAYETKAARARAAALEDLRRWDYDGLDSQGAYCSCVCLGEPRLLPPTEPIRSKKL